MNTDNEERSEPRGSRIGERPPFSGRGYFEVSEGEMATLQHWLDGHIKQCSHWQPHRGEEPEGGNCQLIWKFRPFCFGTIIEVACQCGQEIDITDTDTL